MSKSELKTVWSKNYSTAPEQLEKMGEIKGLISAFNANVDAVIKVSGKDVEELIKKQSTRRKILIFI